TSQKTGRLVSNCVPTPAVPASGRMASARFAIGSLPPMRALLAPSCCMPSTGAAVAWGRRALLMALAASPLALRAQDAAAPVRFGILPLGGAFESRNDWEPLLADLARALGRPVSVLSVTSYAALEQAIQRGEVDMAFLSGRMALDAVTLHGMKVVAQVTRHDGLPGYRALLLGRRGTQPATLQAVLETPERWRLARRQARSVSGYIVPPLQLVLPNRLVMGAHLRGRR